MSEVIRSNAVDQDLLDIWLYIAGDNPDAADRQLERIDHKCRLYATQPEIGQPRPDLGTGVRFFGVDKYVVVYRPREEGIVILLVAHASRDIPPLLRQRFPFFE